MKKILYANVIIVILLIILLQYFDYGYSYTINHFRGDQVFNINDNTDIKSIQKNMDLIAKENDVYVYYNFKYGSVQKTALLNSQKLYHENLSGNEYYSNCLKCEESENKKGVIKSPRYRYVNYVYSFDKINNKNVQGIEFQVHGHKENVSTFLNQISKDYKISYPNQGYIPPNYRVIKNLIYVLILSILIIKVLIIINDARKIAILKLRGITAKEIYYKNIVQEIIKLLYVYIVMYFVLIIAILCYQKNIIFNFLLFSKNYNFYYLLIIGIILVSNLLIFKIGNLNNIMGKLTFSKKFIKNLTILRLFVIVIIGYILLNIGTYIQPTIISYDSLKQYNEYSDYTVAIFDNNKMEELGNEEVNKFANDLYNNTVDKYNGIWIDSSNAISDANCNNDQSNFDVCDSIMANINYIKEEQIKDINGNDIYNQIDTNKKNVLVPICKNNKFDENDLETINGKYTNIINIQCNQKYSSFSTEYIEKDNLYLNDPVIYIVNKDDERIPTNIKYNGNYFINASIEEYKKIVLNLDGNDVVTDYYSKIDDFKDINMVLRNNLITNIFGSMILIISIINIILIESSMYKEIEKQQIRRKMVLGFSKYRVFKERIILNVILFSVLLIISIINALLISQIYPVIIMMIFIIIYILIEEKIMINYRNWRK